MTEVSMKAVVFHKPKDVRVENVPDAGISDARDAVVRVSSTAICGSDLHIYNGFFPQAKSMTLGHEFMGIVEDVGAEVTKLKRGDRVVVPFPIACGACFFCQHELPTGCERSNSNYGPEGGLLKEKGGALFGYTDLYGGIAGGQAEAVRVPFADYGPRKIPEELSDEQVLFLTDIFPTGWSAVDWANVREGETVAVFGCGPVGLMAQKAAWLKGAGQVIGVDVLPYRLRAAERTANALTINAREQDPVARIRELTDGRGADVCIDAVGLEVERPITKQIADVVIHHQAGDITALEKCMSAVRRGGRVSVVGVYGTRYDHYPLGQQMDKAVSLHIGQAPVHNYIDKLLGFVSSGKIKLDDIITHTLPLEDAPHAYDMFCKKTDDCVKVVLKSTV
jgi:S-(hydroxymethyl)glutathione dehydrogenase/alcohol dehydrogenase